MISGADQNGFQLYRAMIDAVGAVFGAGRRRRRWWWWSSRFGTGIGFVFGGWVCVWCFRFLVFVFFCCDDLVEIDDGDKILVRFLEMMMMMMVRR